MGQRAASRSEASEPRRAGRPLDETVKQRVLHAARAELATVGVDGFSLTATLRRAKVGNSGFYRRWEGAQDLILDAVASVATWPEVPDSGDLRTELRVLVETFDRPDAWANLQLLFAFAGQASRYPEMFEHYQRRVMLPSNERVVAIFERACRRGEFSSEADPKALAAAFIGALMIVKQWSVDGSEALQTDLESVLDTFLALCRRPAE